MVSEYLAQNCCTSVLVLAAGALLVVKAFKPRGGGGRVRSVATRAAKKAATRAVFDVLFKRKW